MAPPPPQLDNLKTLLEIPFEALLKTPFRSLGLLLWDNFPKNHECLNLWSTIFKWEPQSQTFYILVSFFLSIFVGLGLAWELVFGLSLGLGLDNKYKCNLRPILGCHRMFKDLTSPRTSSQYLGSKIRVIRDFISGISQETANYFLIEAGLNEKYISAQTEIRQRNYTLSHLTISSFSQWKVSTRNLDSPKEKNLYFTICHYCVSKGHKNVLMADYDKVSHY